MFFTKGKNLAVLVAIVILSLVVYCMFFQNSYSFNTLYAVLNFNQTDTLNKSFLGINSAERRTHTFKGNKKDTLDPGRKKVIVLAYMHTGSTFLGSVLQNHERTFYEYENLHSLMYSTRAGKEIIFLNGTAVRLHPNAEVNNVHHNIDVSVGADAVRKMITCNHREIDVATLANHYFPLAFSVNRHVKPFFQCQEKMFGRSTQLRAKNALNYVQNVMLRNISNAVQILRACLPFLTDKCNQSEMVVEKFIRMTMEMANVLLEHFSDLKIIHLFRDPRAMLDSQVRKNDSGAGVLSVFEGRVRYMCQQMEKDRTLAKKLDERFPGQIYTLRYEDMVDNPMETFKKVYNFIGIPFTEKDELTVKKMTHVSARRNKTLPLSSWRKHIRLHHMQIVDKYCEPLYKEFGYLKINGFSAIRDPSQKDHI